MSHFRLLVPVLLVSVAARASAQYVETHVRPLLDVTKGSSGDLFGWTAVALGDVNGDGVADLAASAPFDDVNASSSGTIYCLSGATGATLWGRAETLQSSILGFALEAIDWNADGVLDVVASAPFSTTGGRVFVWDGASGTQLALLDVSAAGDGFGCSLATGGDFDGDGVEDLAVGALGADTPSGADSGTVFVFTKGTGALVTSIPGPFADAEAGLGLAFLGDVSQPADGRDELVVGNRLAASFFDGEVRVHSFAGGSVSELYVVGGVGMGPNIIGDRIDAGKDVDLDGFPDFLVGDLFRDNAPVFSGLTGALLYTLVGSPLGGNFGAGHLVDDVDHDGRADVAMGAWGADAGAPDSGRVTLFSGATGNWIKDITPDVTDKSLGCEVRGIDDFDGDGRLDLLVGAYGNGGVGLPLGRVLVLSGHVPAPANIHSPSEHVNDPVLLDNAGDPESGPLLASAFEPFNVSLDCTGFTPGSRYAILVTSGLRPVPRVTVRGFRWTTGVTYARYLGRHAGGIVEAVPGGLVVPGDPALIGLEYTAQGWCAGGAARFSDALTQFVGQ